MVSISLLIVAVCRGLEELVNRGYVFHLRLVDIFPFEGVKNLPPDLAFKR